MSAKGMSMRQIVIGCGLVIIAFLAVSGFALWQDGKKWGATQKAPRWAPEGVANPGYLDAAQFQWTTEAVLRDYARAHHAAILNEIAQEQQP